MPEETTRKMPVDPAHSGRNEKDRFSVLRFIGQMKAKDVIIPDSTLPGKW
jgi:hypothetical protein